MTVKLIAMYKKPADEAAFLAHYNDIHLPLVAKLPNLQKTVVNRITGSPMGGEPPYYMIVEMHFADRAAFDEAMASPENRAAGKDVMSFAADLITLVVAEAD